MFSSLLEDVIKNDENTESHIEKESGFTCSNNNILLLVMLGSLWQRNLRISTGLIQLIFTNSVKKFKC